MQFSGYWISVQDGVVTALEDILDETGLKLLEANPELKRKVEALQSGEFEIRNAEDFGLFCLSLAPWVADRARLAAKPK